MSHNGLGTPGEGVRIGEALGLRHEDVESKHSAGVRGIA